MSRSESNILNDSLIALSKAGCKAFRNNTGAWKDPNGRVVRYGLAVGSADVICMTPRLITQEDVGTTIAQFTSVECKTATGRVSPKQIKWRDMVIAAGGRAGIARSAKEAVDISLGNPV